MSLSTHYQVRISHRGLPALPFGWELYHRNSAIEVERSTETFRSRYEAIVDGERAAVLRDERDAGRIQ